MNRNSAIRKGLALAALVGAFTLVSAARTEAAFVAWICNDAACSGEVGITDNGVGDLSPVVGVILANGTTGGVEILFNLSSSKPVLADGMDLNFTAIDTSGGGTAWLYAADTDFAGPQNLIGSIGGTADNGSVTGFICGGNNNSGPSPLNSNCVSGGPFGPGAFAGSVGPFSATANPYSLALGVMVTLSGPGITTGDFRVVPEPLSIALFGLGLSGVAMYRRRRMQVQ